MFYAIIMPNVYLYSYSEIIGDIVKKRFSLVLFKQVSKTWHNVNKLKIDLLINKLRGLPLLLLK